jgi:hypothetical protein
MKAFDYTIAIFSLDSQGQRARIVVGWLIILPPSFAKHLTGKFLRQRTYIVDRID